MFDTFLDPETNLGVGVAFTDRIFNGESSVEPFSGFNFGRSDVVGDCAIAEKLNRLMAITDLTQVVLLNQVHGVEVIRLTEANQALVAFSTGSLQLPASLPVADGVVTSLSGVGLVIRVADCLPVVFADAAAGLIGAAHAGRVGLLGGVLRETVTKLQALGAENLTAWIGPHICAQCYEVPQEMANEAYSWRPEAVSLTRWGTPSVDLEAGAVAELQELAVDVKLCAPCTFETDTLYSHRGDFGQAGRQVGMIWRVSGVAEPLRG